MNENRRKQRNEMFNRVLVAMIKEHVRLKEGATQLLVSDVNKIVNNALSVTNTAMDKLREQDLRG